MLFPVLSSRIHGISDYLIGAAFIFLPWIMGFSNYSYSPWMLMIAGIAIIVYSIMTRYEAGYIGLLSLRTHLLFDLVLGLFLMTSPFLLNFENRLSLPHIAGGALLVLLFLFTNPRATAVHGPQLKPDEKAKPLEL